MGKPKVELSIVIISYNTKSVTKNCIDSILSSLQAGDISYEIIVVDNNSTDGSFQMISDLRSQISDLKLVQSSENLGFAKANNLAVKESTGEYILFLNSDTVVHDNAIEELLNEMKEHSNKVHFIGGKLLNDDGSPQPSCGPFYSLPVVFGALFLKGDYWGLTRSSPTQTQEVDWVSGACILTKREYFDDLKGFDENIFMYMDEVDLLYRAKKKGYRVWFYPEAVFTHLGSASSNKSYPIQQVFRGFLYFYRKHHSPLAMFLLKGMLQLKSGIALVIGRITQNSYLIETYEEAQKLIAMDR